MLRLDLNVVAESVQPCVRTLMHICRHGQMTSIDDGSGTRSRGRVRDGRGVVGRRATGRKALELREPCVYKLTLRSRASTGYTQFRGILGCACL
jgi:hypothetical protein